MLLLLGGCKDDDAPTQQEEPLPTLEEMEIAYIAEESLNGWDAGISFKGGYCVGKRDTIDGTSTLHFNFPNSDADNGITMVFNKEGNIMNIIYANNFFIVNDDNNYTHYTQMDDEGKIIGSYKYNSRLKDDKDSRGLADLGDQLIKMTSKEFMKCCIDGAGYGLDLRDILNNNTSQSVVDGNYRAFLLFSGLNSVIGTSLSNISKLINICKYLDRLVGLTDRLDAIFPNFRFPAAIDFIIEK